MKFDVYFENTIYKERYFESSWGTFHILPRFDAYWRGSKEKQIILGWLCWDITLFFEFEEKEKKLRKQEPPADALRLKDYSDKEGKYFEVMRGKRPEYIPEWDWLSGNSQPFDYITEWTENEEEEMKGFIVPGRRDNGLFIKNMYKACPVCGSRNLSIENFNTLCPEQLAGSSGYYDICNDCGYKYRNVLCQS